MPIEELRRPLPFRLTHGLEDSDLRHAVQLGIGRRLPTCLDHVEFDRLCDQVGLGHPLDQTAGGDTGTIGVHLLVERVDPEDVAMREQGQPARLIEGSQVSQRAASSPSGKSASHSA